MNNTITLEPQATPPQPEAKLFPGIWPALGWVALFLLLQLVAGLIALMVAIATKGAAADPATIANDLTAFAVPMIWSLVISELFLILLLWLYLRRPDKMAALGLDRWSSLSAVKTIGLAVVLVGIGMGVNYAYGEYIVPDIKVQEELRKLFAAIPQTPVNQILLFAAVAVIAPLVEELLFRGLLQKSLSHVLPIWAAIAISALIFASVHIDLYAMPPLLVMGAIFGIIYHVTGSLRVTILLHMVNNAAALLFS
jgi:membrane protease YdiL (CAAX protease family)